MTITKVSERMSLIEQLWKCGMSKKEQDKLIAMSFEELNRAMEQLRKRTQKVEHLKTH